MLEKNGFLNAVSRRAPLELYRVFMYIMQFCRQKSTAWVLTQFFRKEEDMGCGLGQSYGVSTHFPRPSKICRQTDIVGPLCVTARYALLGIQYEFSQRRLVHLGATGSVSRFHARNRTLVQISRAAVLPVAPGERLWQAHF